VAASLDPPVIKKPREGKTVTHLTRPGAEPALAELSLLLDDPTPKQVGKALRTIVSIPGVHMYAYEAWHTVTRALALAESGGTTVEAAVTQLRNQVRVTGRRHSERVISRPVLIKTTPSCSTVTPIRHRVCMWLSPGRGGASPSSARPERSSP